jgi:hypothetical protein
MPPQIVSQTIDIDVVEKGTAVAPRLRQIIVEQSNGIEWK